MHCSNIRSFLRGPKLNSLRHRRSKPSVYYTNGLDVRVGRLQRRVHCACILYQRSHLIVRRRFRMDVRNFETVLDCGIHTVDSGFQILDSGPSASGPWSPDCNRCWDSGFLELYSRFQSPAFLIPQAKISQGPECGFPCTCDTKTCQLQTDGTLELFLFKEALLTVTNAFQK